MRSPIPSRLVPFLLPLFVACSSSDPPAGTPDGAADTGKADTGGGGDGGCEDPGTIFVKNVTGKAVDTTGKALVGKPISVCGTICYPAVTKADGAFDVAVNECLKVEIFSASVHGRPDSASLYQRVPPVVAGVIAFADPFRVPPLPADGPRIPMDAKSGDITATTTIESGGLSLTFNAGTHVQLDIEDIELAALGEKLRVVKVEEKDYPPFVKGENVLALYAANPFDAAFTKGKVGITMAAPAGLAAGAVVEFISLGNAFLEAPFDAGKIAIVGKGKVSSDGKTVTTDAGVGLTALTWVGVRAAK